jgi:hypothetical protein
LSCSKRALISSPCKTTGVPASCVVLEYKLMGECYMARACDQPNRIVSGMIHSTAPFVPKYMSFITKYPVILQGDGTRGSISAPSVRARVECLIRSEHDVICGCKQVVLFGTMCQSN